ncbi:MAG: YkgJ family cysteine cluster protein, partial [Luteolibacter sp.]
MPDAPPISACQTCSACCDHPEPWATIRLSLDDMHRIPADLQTPTGEGAVQKLRKIGNRCIALIGTVGIDARCGIYDIRPAICREFDPATRVSECN